MKNLISTLILLASLLACSSKSLERKNQLSDSSKKSLPGGEYSMLASLNLSLVQFPIENSKSLQQFLSKVGRFLDQGAAAGSDLIVFPELFILDMISRGTPAEEAEELRKMAEKETPLIVNYFKQEAVKRQKNILAGSIPRFENGEIRNTAYLFFADGRVVFQDKIFLTPDEVNWGWKGGDKITMIEAPWGKTVILICYDSQFAAFSENLAKFSPELILVPSMTGEKGLNRVRWGSQARAIEQHAYVAVTGTVDAIRGTDYVGQAVLITPSEVGLPGILKEGKLNKEETVSMTLDFKKLRESRVTTGIFSARDYQQRKTPIYYSVDER